MLYLPSPGRPSRRVLLALALAAATPGLAQYPGGAIVQPLPGADDPAEKLAAALRTLAVGPRDLGALIEAGRDALTLGDPNAAVGFFGRASEVSPRDGRVKAGLGAALVQLEKPRDALRYFQEASALGVPDADLADDRGLAYDLIGDPVQAQRDYQTVLAAHPEDDAVRRKLALSQGISGNRAGAIATLDPLIRKRDIAAWRAQTFVLAMTGDTRGANDITRIMLPQQQALLQPFLERLPTLSPGDKARAVHFGEMPAAGRSYSDTQLASVGTTPTYAPAPAPARPTPIPTRPAPLPTPVASSPGVAPVRVASGPPSVAAAPAAVPLAPASTVRPRFVSPTGVPMRRIEHTMQEMMALGLPRYDYVPLTDGASPTPPGPHLATTATLAPAVQPRVSVATAAVVEPAAAAAASTTLPSVTTAAAIGPLRAPIETAAAPSPAVPAPAPIVASAGTGPTMPLGASGAGGHFDVPHEIAERQPVPRAEQQSARPPIAVAPRPTLAPTVAAAPEPASANPTVAVARRARSGQVQIASVDRSVRTGRTRGVVASATDAGDTAAPADDGVKPSIRTTHGGDKAVTRTAKEEEPTTDRKAKHGDRARTAAREEDGGKASAKADDGASADRKGRHGARTRTRTAPQDEDDGTSGRRHGKDRPDTDRGRHGDPSDDKTDRSDKTEKGSSAKVYVQVAGGANREDMDKAWAGVKAKAPELMKGRTPSTTPLKATNRLLVGPFKDDAEAQAFVNKMAGKGVSGFTFKSSKGQKVDKVDAGK